MSINVDPKWSAALVQAPSDHLIQGFLWAYANQYLTVEKYQLFRQVYLSQWRHNLLLKRELELLDAPAGCVVLKGIPLLERCYDDHMGARQCSDIDLWVENQQQLTLLEEKLELLGHKCRQRGKWWGDRHKDVWSRVNADGEIVVEVHQGRLFYHMPVIPVFKQEWKFGLNTLSDEMNLCYLIGHMAFQHNFSKLIWLIDIAQFLQSAPAMDWEEIFWLSHKMQLYRSHEMTFWLMNNYFKHERRPWNQYFQINGSRIWQEMLTKEFLVDGRSQSWTYYLLKHLTKDSLATSLLYDVKWPLAVMREMLATALPKR